MNFGNSIKKFAANINVGLKLFKAAGGWKLNWDNAVHDTIKNKKAILKEQFDSLPFGLNQKENCFFFFPKTDLAIKKNIIEPDQSTKIKVKLPIRYNKNNLLELPLHIEKEISEPSAQVVIIKKARHLIVIRRKKMKKHKKKKHLKKFKIQIQTRKLRKELLEEAALQNEMRLLIQSSTNFSAEDHVTEKLEKFNWVKPVTVVRGRLAPDWVIKNHLKNEEEKKTFRERVEECLNAKK